MLTFEDQSTTMWKSIIGLWFLYGLVILTVVIYTLCLPNTATILYRKSLVVYKNLWKKG